MDIFDLSPVEQQAAIAREKAGTLVDRLRKQAARIAALEAENARLREACEAAREWLNRVGANSPVIFGGEAELDEQLRAALGGAK